MESLVPKRQAKTDRLDGKSSFPETIQNTRKSRFQPIYNSKLNVREKYLHKRDAAV